MPHLKAVGGKGKMLLDPGPCCHAEIQMLC